MTFTKDELLTALYAAFRDMGFTDLDYTLVTEEQAAEAEERALAMLIEAEREARKHPHHCHWPGCTKEVPPKLFMCRSHWYALPIRLRNKVWAAYREGQEITKTPSPEYIQVAKEVQAWIQANHPT